MQSAGESGRIEKQQSQRILSRQLCSKGKAHERIRYRTNELEGAGRLDGREDTLIRHTAHHSSRRMAGAGASRCGTFYCQSSSILYVCAEGMYRHCDM